MVTRIITEYKIMQIAKPIRCHSAGTSNERQWNTRTSQRTAPGQASDSQALKSTRCTAILAIKYSQKGGDHGGPISLLLASSAHPLVSTHKEFRASAHAPGHCQTHPVLEFAAFSLVVITCKHTKQQCCPNLPLPRGLPAQPL